MRNKINKYRNVILLVIGTLLVILSLCLLFYDRFGVLRSNVFAEIELEKYRENNLNDDDEGEETTDEVEANTDYVEDEDEEDDSGNSSTSKTSSKKKTSATVQKKRDEERAIIAKEYIGYLEIKKINLKQGLLSKNSYYNDVKYNVQTITTSDYPDKSLGNFILAAHSGTGYYGFFKDLYKLSKGDEAKVYYKGYVYTYKLVNIYTVPKVGTVKVVRDIYKTCLTLITCTHDSKTEQTVNIFELTSKVKEGGKK